MSHKQWHYHPALYSPTRRSLKHTQKHNSTHKAGKGDRHPFRSTKAGIRRVILVKNPT